MDIFGTERAALKAELNVAELTARIFMRRYNELNQKWNQLVNAINNKGGQNFLDNATLNGPSQFTPAEIDTLIRLCHPDKHGNSAAANSITQRLLGMRKK